MVDIALLWIAIYGVWPLADTGHGLDTVASWFDIALHVAAWLALNARWKIVRRRSEVV